MTALPVRYCAQVNESGVYLLPTHEENIIQHSARLSGSQELGGGQFSPAHVPVPKVSKSNMANTELFMVHSPYFRKFFVNTVICDKTRACHSLII